MRRAFLIACCFCLLFNGPSFGGAVFSDREGFLRKYAGVEFKTFLYKISKGNREAFILGSIHVFNRDDYPLDERIENAFNSSKELVLEIDLEKHQAPSYLQDPRFTRLAEGRTLEETLSSADLSELKAEMKSVGLDIEEFYDYQPWILWQLIGLKKLEQQGFSTYDGIDNYFYRKAKARNLPVSGLETPEEREVLYRTLSESQDDLLAMSRNDFRMIDEYRLLLNFWKTGSSFGMYQYMNTGYNQSAASKRVYRALIIDRNVIMARRIAEMFARGDSFFIIIGAAHLPGDEGVLHLLKMKGFAVEQL